MKTMRRREFLRSCGLGAAAIALARGAGGKSPAPPRPNVLILLTDDQRSDTIGAMGNRHIQTPNLDSLVKSGTVFTNAYCMGGYMNGICTPSRMQLFRGRSWFVVKDLPADSPNLAQSMTQAGYTSYSCAKSGNSDKASHKLFTRHEYVSTKLRRSGYPGRAEANKAIAFLKDRRAADKPFFMYLAFGCPHDPRIVNKEYLDKYDPEKIPLPPNFMPHHPFNNGWLGGRDERLAAWPRTKQEIRKHLRDYYGVITYIDYEIGRIIEALKAAGQYDNTIIIFSSDQGLALGSHGLMGKQSLYEHSMGVPMIFCGPGVPKGRSSDAFMYLFDLFPTVCELVGAPVPAGLDGRSLAGVIRADRKTVRDTIFLGYVNLHRAVRKGRWKLHRYPQVDKTLLFDLSNDPHETRDLSAEASQRDRVRELLALMAREQKKFGDTLPLTVKNPAPSKIDISFFKGLHQKNIRWWPSMEYSS